MTLRVPEPSEAQRKRAPLRRGEVACLFWVCTHALCSCQTIPWPKDCGGYCPDLGSSQTIESIDWATTYKTDATTGALIKEALLVALHLTQAHDTIDQQLKTSCGALLSGLGRSALAPRAPSSAAEVCQAAQAALDAEKAKLGPEATFFLVTTPVSCERSTEPECASVCPWPGAACDVACRLRAMPTEKCPLLKLTLMVDNARDARAAALYKNVLEASLPAPVAFTSAMRTDAINASALDRAEVTLKRMREVLSELPRGKCCLPLPLRMGVDALAALRQDLTATTALLATATTPQTPPSNPRTTTR